MTLIRKLKLELSTVGCQLGAPWGAHFLNAWERLREKEHDQGKEGERPRRLCWEDELEETSRVHLLPWVPLLCEQTGTSSSARPSHSGSNWKQRWRSRRKLEVPLKVQEARGRSFPGVQMSSLVMHVPQGPQPVLVTDA